MRSPPSSQGRHGKTFYFLFFILFLLFISRGKSARTHARAHTPHATYDPVGQTPGSRSVFCLFWGGFSSIHSFLCLVRVHLDTESIFIYLFCIYSFILRAEKARARVHTRARSMQHMIREVGQTACNRFLFGLFWGGFSSIHSFLCVVRVHIDIEIIYIYCYLVFTYYYSRGKSARTHSHMHTLRAAYDPVGRSNGVQPLFVLPFFGRIFLESFFFMCRTRAS